MSDSLKGSWADNIKFDGEGDSSAWIVITAICGVIIVAILICAYIVYRKEKKRQMDGTYAQNQTQPIVQSTSMTTEMENSTMG